MHKLCAVLFLALMSFACAAQPFVYRADTRPPADIFRQGFTPPGTNTNLYRHVQGVTCYLAARSTGFVSTSSNEDFATSWGTNFPDGTHFFVYRILPGPIFHNTTRSLMHAFSLTGNNAYQDTAFRFVGQAEWASAGVIPPERVVDAVAYVSHGLGNEAERIGREINAGYVALPASPSEAPFVWNYAEDGVPVRPSLCAATCFATSPGPSGGRGKREDVSDDTKRANARRCRGDVGKRSVLLQLYGNMSAVRADETDAREDI